MSDTLRRRTESLMRDLTNRLPGEIALPGEASLPQNTDYGVDHDDANVILSLGDAPAFKIPQPTAIKLALLILKHAGVDVKVD